MTPSQTPPLPETLSDALRDAAPDQELIIDGDVRLDAETLRERATALARTLREELGLQFWEDLPRLKPSKRAKAMAAEVIAAARAR